MSDPKRGKYKAEYKADFAAAAERLAPFKGVLAWGVHDYEAFTFKSADASLIFYPHRTSAWNYHIRVRDSHSKDKKRMRAAITALAENSCTFQCPTEHEAHRRGVSQYVQREFAPATPNPKPAKAAPQTITRSVDCNYCYRSAELVDGSVLYPNAPNLANKKFWRCEHCDAWVGTHEDSKTFEPLGRLANAELRKWKQTAHNAFDPFWRGQGWTRKAAYKWLSEQMGMSRSQAHIGKFDVPACQKLVEIIATQTVEST